MENLETGKDKIKKISEILKTETLEPAKEEAQRIIEQAHQDAHEIIRAAEKKREEIVQNGKIALEKERAVFQTSLVQACKQGVEALKQDIEEHFFNKELLGMIRDVTSQPQIIAKIVDVLVEAIKKNGLNADFLIALPAKVTKDDLVKHLTAHTIEKIKQQPMVVGNFIGGVQIMLEGQNMMIDMSDQALRELLEKYIGKHFRHFLFEQA